MNFCEIGQSDDCETDRSRSFSTNNNTPAHQRGGSNVDVGKCGDADALIEEHCESSTYICHAHRWRPVVLNGPNNPTTASHSIRCKTDSHEKRCWSPYPKSPETEVLQEPPTLRRAVAYLDFEDGDNEPDESNADVNYDKKRCSGCDSEANDVQATIAIPSALNQVTPWRLRLYEILKKNFFWLKRYQLKHSSSVIPNKFPVESAISSGEDTYKHLPKGDLFHQYDVMDTDHASPTNFTPLMRKLSGELYFPVH